MEKNKLKKLKNLQVYTVGKVRNPGASLKCRDVEM